MDSQKNEIYKSEGCGGCCAGIRGWSIVGGGNIL